MADVRISNLLKTIIDNSEYILGKKMNITDFALEIGVSRSVISDAVNAYREPSKSVVKKIHEKYGINLLDEWILARTEEDPQGVLLDLKHAHEFSCSGNDLKKDSNQLQKENSTLQNIVDSLKSEISSLKTEVEQLKTERDELRGQVKLLREMLTRSQGSQ